MTLIPVSGVSCQCWFLFRYLFSLINVVKLPFLALHFFHVLLVGCSNVHGFLLILLLNVWAKYGDMVRQTTRIFLTSGFFTCSSTERFPTNTAVRSIQQVNFSYEDSGKMSYGYLPEFLNDHKVFIKRAKSIGI